MNKSHITIVLIMYGISAACQPYCKPPLSRVISVISNFYCSTGPYKLRVDMEDWSGKKYFAEYDYFRVDNEANNYRLHVRGYHGDAGDSLTSVRDNHNGMAFSTRDKDNDRRTYNNCAEHYK